MSSITKKIKQFFTSLFREKQWVRCGQCCRTIETIECITFDCCSQQMQPYTPLREGKVKSGSNGPPTGPRPKVRPKPQRKLKEGYQPVATEGFTGPGQPPTGGSGARPASPDNQIDLSDKTIRLYEDCPECNGTGSANPPNVCPKCWGKRTVTTHVKFSDLNLAMQEIAKAAVEQALAEKEVRRWPRSDHAEGMGSTDTDKEDKDED